MMRIKFVLLIRLGWAQKKISRHHTFKCYSHLENFFSFSKNILTTMYKTGIM